MANKIITSNFSDMERLCREFGAETANIRHIEEAAAAMTACIRNGGQIFACGNGGSLCDAAHFAEELSARFRHNRRALPAQAITDPAYLTCVANDFGFEQTVSRYLEASGRRGDVLLAISTSGNSSNILAGARFAIEHGIRVIALTGKDGGELAHNCDIEIRVPWNEYSDRIQEIHIKVIHTLVQLIEQALEVDR